MFEDFKTTVHWAIEDGYVGKDRPQKTVIKPSDNFSEEEWNEMDEHDRTEFIEEMVREDFEQKITWYIKSIE